MPGSGYVHEGSNERCVVVGIEDWPGPERALLQHEDGRAGTVTLESGRLPPAYRPLPSPKSDHPELADACAPDAHRFDLAPVTHAPDPVACETCGLTSHALMDHLGHAVWDRYPADCAACDRTLAPADDRLFTHDRFVCPDCQGDHWDVFADRPVAALDRCLLVCHDSPLTPGSGDCGVVVQATTATTRRHLHPVRGATATDDGCASCPGCGHDHLTVVEPAARVVERLARAADVAVPADPVARDLFPPGSRRHRLDPRHARTREWVPG